MSFSKIITKKTLVIVMLIALIMMSGCLGQDSSSGEDLAEDTGNQVDTKIGNFESLWFEMRITEENQNGLVRSQPPEIMEQSLERENLIRRYNYLNDKGNFHHVYLMSNDGKVMSYFVAEGKVSSVNSKLTNDAQIVRIPSCEPHNNGNDCWKKVESPQMDGSYGENGNAIFFFTGDGQYVEANTKYIVSEKPLNIQTALSLEHEVDYDGGSAENSTEAPE